MLMRIIGLLLAVLVGWVSWQAYNSSIPPPLPTIERIYKKESGKEQKPIARPFTINVSNQVLEDLNRRLSTAREFTPPLRNIGFQYGFNTDYLKKVINFWKTKYDWRKQEKFLNSLPQYTMEIGQLNIHFIHAKPPTNTKLKVLPILLLHGWPGSVREFYELIPMLTTPQPNRDFVFEVIAPSLPGYGFSDIPKDKGYNTAVHAKIMVELMQNLGIQKFYVQGGDWGAAIGSFMATLYPSVVLGFHSNMCAVSSLTSNLKHIIGSFWPSLIAEPNEIEKFVTWKEQFGYFMVEGGYFHLQATKPDTVGVALNDSPVGLAAYILEKFSTWTNKKNREHLEGNLEQKFTLTKLLDNVMIYWVTGTITSSMRFYSEHMAADSPTFLIDSHPVTVPTACARFPEELANYPVSILKDKFVNLTRVSDPPRGGHFASFEEPKLVADDIYESIQLIERKYYR